MKSWPALGIVITACVIFAWWCFPERHNQQVAPLTHHLYIWNRIWNDTVGAAIKTASTKVYRYVVLAAQIDNEKGLPVPTRIPIEFSVLRDTGAQIGMAIRVSSFPSTATQSQVIRSAVESTAKDLILDASRENLTLSEIQLDYDCPESRLDEYRDWIEALKPVVSPVSLTITALPAWLKQSEFEDLAKATDGFVLQVHSFKTPKSLDDDLTLCNPEQVSRWVKQASQMGVPFRVALPTYGYVIAFDPKGKYASLWAEGPQPDWPPGYQFREVHTDPKQIARIVRDLHSASPPNLTGILWFRMPTDNDQMNWRWSTLAAVMDGREPKPKLEVRLRQEVPGLLDLDLVNTGEADADSGVAVSVSWEDNRLLAMDGLGGFAGDQPMPNVICFNKDRERLRAGETRAVGWLRFDKNAEVHVDVHTQD